MDRSFLVYSADAVQLYYKLILVSLLP